MANWLSASFIALFGFGMWGLFTKISVEYIGFKSALIYQTIGVVVVALISLALVDFHPETNARGIWFALLTGLAYGAGCLFYFLAASKGKIITVVTLTAMYPIVTIGLAYIFLGETINLRQTIGILLAFVAILLLSTS